MELSVSLLNKAAYGGKKWLPRSRTMRQDIGKIWAQCGISTEWSPLKSVLLHKPGAELVNEADPDSLQMLENVNVHRAAKQHTNLVHCYEKNGVMVHFLKPSEIPPPNQMYIADLLFMTPEGAIIGRPASDIRAGEEKYVAQRLLELNIPILRTISGTATFEGADALWLNPNQVVIGRGLRTNEVAIEQIESVLKGMNVEVIKVDLPYGTMHLMGMIRIVDKNLAIVWPTRVAQYLVDTLKKQEFTILSIPDLNEAINGYALNFVTLGPRQIVMPAGNANTKKYFEKHAITCHTVEVDEIVKAAGSIGCLTGVLEREMN